jgi:hypothetical protein
MKAAKYLVTALFFIVLFLNTEMSYSQCNSEWKWAKKFTGPEDEYVNGSTVDKWGNIYVVGEFMGQKLVADSVTLNKKGYGTSFIIKYSSDGKLIWAKAFGGGEEDIAIAVTTDKIGNVYVVGTFESTTIKFDTFTLYNYKTYNTTMYLVSFLSDGNVRWVKRAGCAENSNDVYPGGISVDSFGNVVTVGFWANGSLINIDGNIFNKNNNATQNPYVIRYSSNGLFKWAKVLSNTGPTGVPIGAECKSVCTDKNGNIYVGGTYSYTLNLDTFQLNNGVYYMFLVKYDSTGKVRWAKSAKEESVPHSLTVDNSGNLYVAGYAYPLVNKPFRIDTFKMVYLYDRFGGLFFKIDSTGSVKWMKAIQGNNNQEVYKVALDASGNPYITGYYQSDSMKIENFWIKRVGWYNAFVIKYAKDGKFKWILVSKGTNKNTYVKAFGGCSVDNKGDVVVTGSYKIYNAVFGKDTLRTPDVLFYEGFITKIKSDVDVLANLQLPKCKGDKNGSITLAGFGGTAPYSYSWQGGLTGNKRTGLGTGWYVYTITDKNNCSYTDSVMLPEPVALQLSLTIKDDSNGKKKGEATVKVTGGTIPYSYQWNDPSNQKTAKAINLGAGNYKITVTDKNGCIKDTTITINNKIGIAEVFATKVFVYPNPVFDGLLNIQIQQLPQDITLGLYDGIGREIISRKIQAGSSYHDQLTLPNKGIYILKVEMGGKMFSRNVVVE